MKWISMASSGSRGARENEGVRPTISELPYSHMPAPIFISYARRTSLAEARALKAQLGDLAFLDETEIPSHEQFAKVIAKGLMEARLAVVFADDTYFDRPYCRWEWSLILRDRKSEEHTSELQSLRHLVC